MKIRSEAGRYRCDELHEQRWWAVPLAGAIALTGFNPAAGTAATSNSAPICQPASPGGPVFITESCTDPVLNQPYVDVDKAETTTDPATGVTVSYRYIHGGFTGANGRFSFYFPSSRQYRGRFFESTYPTVSTEGATADEIAFGISHGAYVVSSNNAGGVPAGRGIRCPSHRSHLRH